jgi:hypothetical protein
LEQENQGVIPSLLKANTASADQPPPPNNYEQAEDAEDDKIQAIAEHG